MPIPLPAAAILATASLILIFGRGKTLLTVRVIGAAALTALLGAMACLVYEQPIPFSSAEITNATPTPWGRDFLALAEQWIAVQFAALAGVSIYDSIRQQRVAPVALGYFLFVVAGMLLSVQANDFFSLGLSFEITDLARRAFEKLLLAPTEPATTVQKAPTFSTLLNGMTRIWMWLGIALITNTTSNTNFDIIRQILANAYVANENPQHIGSPSKLVLLATGLILVNLFVRLILSIAQSVVKMDVEARPSSVPALLAIGQQFIVTSVLIRLMGTVFTGISHALTTLVLAVTFTILAASCLLVFRGRTAGAKSLPRLTTALGLLQAGWFAIALITAAMELDNTNIRFAVFQEQHETLAVLVLIQYSWLLASLSLVGLLGTFQRADRELLFIEDLRGLWAHSPVAAVGLTAALGCLIGFPFTAGFWSRWMTFLAGSNVHWKSTSMILTPFEGLRLSMLLAIVATAVNASLAVNVIREIFLETPLSRPQASDSCWERTSWLVAASLGLVLGIIPQIALVPLAHIHPPASIEFESPRTGSGATPVGDIAPQEPLDKRS